MTVKQADAINAKYKIQEATIDSLKKCSNFLNKQVDSLKNSSNLLKDKLDNLKDYSITLNKTIDSLKTLKPQTNCDSLTYLIKDWAYKPTLVYFYNDKIHALDLSLYKIRFTIDGVVEISKLTKKEMSMYHQLLHSGGTNLVDWRKEFIKFDLPLVEDIDKLK